MNYIIRKGNELLDRVGEQFINEQYDIHTIIMLDNIGRPKYSFIDGEKDEKICRFCGRTNEEVGFDNKSHVIPKFLGNFLVISNFECDECNSFFSRYETELEKYVKIPLIANKNKQLKDRTAKNISRIGGMIEATEGEKERVEFNSLFVLKVLMKFGYSMLLDNEIMDYTILKESIIKEDIIPDKNYLLDITLRKPNSANTIILYESKNDKYVDNIVSLNFNMKKYVWFLDKDKNDHKIDDQIIKEDYLKLFTDYDIYNYRTRNFSLKNFVIKFNIDKFLEFLN